MSCDSFYSCNKTSVYKNRGGTDAFRSSRRTRGFASARRSVGKDRRHPERLRRDHAVTFSCSTRRARIAPLPYRATLTHRTLCVPMQIRECGDLTEKHPYRPYFYTRWFCCMNKSCRTTLVMRRSAGRGRRRELQLAFVYSCPLDFRRSPAIWLVTKPCLGQAERDCRTGRPSP